MKDSDTYSAVLCPVTAAVPEGSCPFGGRLRVSESGGGSLRANLGRLEVSYHAWHVFNPRFAMKDSNAHTARLCLSIKADTDGSSSFGGRFCNA